MAKKVKANLEFLLVKAELKGVPDSTAGTVPIVESISGVSPTSVVSL